MDFSQSDGLVVVVLTHGDKGGILQAKDTAYKTNDVWEPFKNCKGLRGKPKIFMFQV